MVSAPSGPASPWRHEMRSPRKIFITGASGLVGEGVLHQMLRDDPALHAFALVRNDLRWRYVGSRLGALVSRGVPVRGDTTLPGMGLEPLARQRVERETH